METGIMVGAHALEGLIDWTHREEWREAASDAIDRHLNAACSAAGVEIEELPELIGEDLFILLWGFAFEDLISRTLEDGRNIAENYLKRRGWKESKATRAYIAELRSSVVSLYEVSGIVPGESFLVRDLIRGGAPVRVFDRAASQDLAQWDRIAARVITLDGRKGITGGNLLFDHKASDLALGLIKRVMRQLRRKAAKLAQGQDRAADGPSLEALMGIDAILAEAPHVFSNVWLRNALDRILDSSPPQLINADAEPIVFVSIRYPIVPLVTAEAIRGALTSAPELRQDDDRHWTWWESDPPERRPSIDAPAAVRLITADDRGGVVLGNIVLDGETVTLSVNSEKRMMGGQALVERLLAGLVEEPSIERQTVEQLQMAAKGGGRSKPTNNLPPEEERAIIHDFVTDHYRRTLDERLPLLGNVTPRRAVTTAKGREKVIAWLKMLENDSARKPADDPLRDYDFRWLWDELGLADERR